MKHFSLLFNFAIMALLILLSGCAFLGTREVTSNNYYVLDYLSATENPDLVQSKAFDYTLEVSDSHLPRTYDRNQIVKKKSYTEISYFSYDLWSNRLYDAIPNLMTRRIAAYNIFRSVARDLGDTKPDYFLESNIQNIEYVEASQPYASLNIVLSLVDGKTQQIIFTNRDERVKLLYDKSVDFLVQSFNEMIMAETDLFAAKCINYLNGQAVENSNLDLKQVKVKIPEYTTQVIETGDIIDRDTGQLIVPLLTYSETSLPFVATYLDSTIIRQKEVTGLMNEAITLHAGRWKIELGSDQNISTVVNILPNMRTVVTPFWSELIVHIVDISQTRVQMRYDVYEKTPGQDSFDNRISSRVSPADEIGEYDYLWLLKPGRYMITLNGASTSSLKDFTTVFMEDGKSYILSIVVDPQGERNVLLGAGVLEAQKTKGKPRIHKGAMHLNLNLASSNSVSKDNPTRSLVLSGQLDNKLDYDVWPLHYMTRSLYDLGLDKTTGTDFRVNLDDYSLKNALVFYPWKINKVMKNFGMYGRIDGSTHFFKEYAFYTEDKHFLKINQHQDSLFAGTGKKLLVADEFYPLQLKEGTGLTYRINLSTKMSVNLLSGFGWQQDYENSVYSLVKPLVIDSVAYERYQENPTTKTQGIETSLLIGINNLLDFINVTSTTDVLFPLGASDKSTKYDSDNIINIKLLRNISVDLRAKVQYNKAQKDYVQTDYSAILRLSLYY